jgi:hypothetical protein
LRGLSCWCGFGLHGILAVLLAACDQGFRPETLVDDLRLLGVQSNPAEISPGESAALQALVLNPSRPNDAYTVLWVGCEADPFNENRSVCSDPELVTDVSKLTGGSGVLPKGVSLIGFNSNATFQAPAKLFEALPLDDSRRKNGTVAQIVLIAVAQEISLTAPREEFEKLFQRVQLKEVKAIVGIYRLRISENVKKNHNPMLTGITLDGETWPRGARIPVKSGAQLPVSVALTDDSFETFELETPTGVQTQTEKMLVAWYSTAGLFTKDRVAVGAEVQSAFKSPDGSDKNKIPEKRVGELLAVVRDTRGAQAFQRNPIFVCDETLAPVEISNVIWPQSANSPIRIVGQHLENVLDVLVDGAALLSPRFVASENVFEATWPSAVIIGARRGFVTSKSCQRIPL